MAISPFVLDYLETIALHFDGNERGSILELGEAVTVGMDLADRLPRIADVTSRPLSRLQDELAECRRDANDRLYAEARAIYRWILGCDEYHAADLSARDPLFRVDLNQPFELKRRFDAVVNNGTSEHVFNQANVFQMMHEHTMPNGVMIHYTPGIGWIDHGFYSVQPHFFFDLAKYNEYEVLSCALVNEKIIYPLRLGEFSSEAIATNPLLDDALICCCMRRLSDKPFRYPTQYLYQ